MFDFDPTVDGPTPEHVRWTIAHECPLRAGTDVNDPDQTERLLRGVSHASWPDDRLVNGLVIRERAGCGIVAFDAQRHLDPFGGVEVVARSCGNCVANVKSLFPSPPWAACHGMVWLPTDPARRADLLAAIDAPANPDIATRMSQPSVPNRWYRMWAEFPGDDPDQQAARKHELALIARSAREAVTLAHGMEWESWMLFGLAMYKVAKVPELTCKIRVHPAGLVTARTWQVDPHCIRCKASWWNKKQKTCAMCGHEGGRQESRTRKRIGIRPFRPIEEFVPAEQVPRIVDAWRAKCGPQSP